MKLKVNWKELMKQIWTAIKPVLLGAIGGGIVGVASGCSSMTPSDKTQTMGVYAFGIPGIDMLFFGPADFSQSIGQPTNIGNEITMAAKKKVAEVARAHGKFAGTVGDPS